MVSCSHINTIDSEVLCSICRLESLKKLCIIWQDNWKLLLFVGDYDYLVKLLEEILRLLIVAVILLAA